MEKDEKSESKNWNAIVDEVSQCIMDGHPDDQILAMYLEIHKEYQVCP